MPPAPVFTIFLLHRLTKTYVQVCFKKLTNFSDECIHFAGTYIINLRRTWEKLVLAARAIAAIENPSDVCVISARPYGQRAILKFAVHTGATPIAGRFTPGLQCLHLVMNEWLENHFMEGRRQ